MIVLCLDTHPHAAVLVRHLERSRRLRFELPGLRGRTARASVIAAELLARAGVVAAHVDARSGRAVVTYDASARFLAELEERPEPAPAVVAPTRRAQADGGEPWHAMELADVLARLDVGIGGLSSAAAARRLEEFGSNGGEQLHERSRLEILFDQVANLPTSMLLGSSLLSTALGELLDAGAILGVVGMDAAIGYSIEKGNAELLASWRKLQAGQTHVIRDGAIRTVSALDLVPGDLLFLRAGDTVPADARIVDAHRLGCNESMLTGESEAQSKSPEPVGVERPLAERSSMLYAGTMLESGRCRAVVTATGAGTEIAAIGRLLIEEQAPQTPLERRLEVLGRRFAFGGIAAGALAGVLGFARGRPFGDVMRTAAALGVAAVPEGLPVVATAALTRSMQRMRENGMVVRRLASAETLGAVTVICSDKTGTLTENRMSLEVLEVDGGPVDPAAVVANADDIFADPATLALAAGILNSDVDVHHRGADRDLFGSATETALVRAGQAAGLSRTRLRHEYPRRALRERTAGKHYVVSVHGTPTRVGLAFIKGAPEQVLPLCSHFDGGPLRPSVRRRFLRRNEQMAADGLRVLALGYRRLRRGDAGDRDAGFTFLGLVGLRDPVRPGAADALRAAAAAGIRTVILTGDQRPTAEATARAVGLVGRTLDGAEAARAIAAADASALDGVAVLSRVTPADKLAIVRALRERGEVVAMAGDGINDAPALKAADVGIAVGVAASDLTRHAADVVLETEDLRSILAAVGEGRIVQDNLKRAIQYLMATNISESVLVLGAAAAGLTTPLTSLQLLWINLLTDTVPALALALEPGRPDVLARGPTLPDAPLMSADMRREVLRDGMILSGISLAALVVGGPPAAFAAVTSAQLGYTIYCRASDAPPSPRFQQLMALAGGLQLTTLAVPPLRSLLGLPSRVAPLEVAGFVGGFVVPWLLSPRDDVIVRRGTAASARPRPATAPAPALDTISPRRAAVVTRQRRNA
jgi:Ca2+-transporting ATPase